MGAQPHRNFKEGGQDTTVGAPPPAVFPHSGIPTLLWPPANFIYNISVADSMLQKTVIDEAQKYGVSLDAAQASLFVKYIQILNEWNAKMNLTGIRQPNLQISKLIAPAFAYVRVLDTAFTGKADPGKHAPASGAASVPPDPAPAAPPPPSANLKFADIGSGAGIPGIPIKICRPAWEALLVESIGKKCKFLEAAVKGLGFAGARVLCGRAEDLARISHIHTGKDMFTGSQDAVVLRSVAKQATNLKLAAPWVRSDGKIVVILSTGENPDPGAAICAKLGISLQQSDKYPEFQLAVYTKK